MRTLIISDIHANLTALDTVLDHAQSFDRVWCLGDVVGYGPDPNACIRRIQNLPLLKCIKGNHDAAIIGEINVAAFNYEARDSLRWLENVLRPENKQWLQNLEERFELRDVTLVHGSPRSPVWEYVMDVQTARENMDAFDTQVCLVGHTHVPCIFMQLEGNLSSTKLFTLPIDEPIKLEGKCIVNPGSIGQPRDHDPRASYLIYDDENDLWTNHRVAYDYEQVQTRILAAGLPNRHAYRLSQGW